MRVTNIFFCANKLVPSITSRNWHRNGELLHPGQPDKDHDQKAETKIANYRELYRDHRRQLDFLPAIASTSGRILQIHCELLRLLFLHAHR